MNCGIKFPLIGINGARSKKQKLDIKGWRIAMKKNGEDFTKTKPKPAISGAQERDKAKPLKKLEPLIAAPSSARK